LGWYGVSGPLTRATETLRSWAVSTHKTIVRQEWEMICKPTAVRQTLGTCCAADARGSLAGGSCVPGLALGKSARMIHPEGQGLSSSRFLFQGNRMNVLLTTN